MAQHAKKMVQKNGYSKIIEVIQSSVEDLILPSQVDIIISEWMGYMLLRESMIDSVIRARDQWLKPNGVMFPSHATMYWGCVSHEADRVSRKDEFQGMFFSLLLYGNNYYLYILYIIFIFILKYSTLFCI